MGLDGTFTKCIYIESMLWTDCLWQTEKGVIMNVIPAESFFGIFYQKPME